MCSFLKKLPFWYTFNLVHHQQISNCTKRLLSSIVSPNAIQGPRVMKGRAASNEQKRIITEYVTECDVTKLDWNILRKSILSINRGYINEKNINGCILEECAHQKRLDLAKSFLNYVKKNSLTKPNIGLELLYIRACYASRNQLTDNDKHEIQTTCQLLFKNYSHLLNSVFLEGIVMGLCCTPLWRDSLEYMKFIKNENEITINTRISVIVKAFEEKEMDLGWNLTQSIFNNFETLPIDVLISWFDLCDKNKLSDYVRVLEFLSTSEYVIQEDLADLIRENFQKIGSKITNTIITHYNGKCKNCDQVLKPINITEAEFNKLQESFMSNVMIGKNIFNNSSPQELNNFKDFIKMTGPYDVVVDGLNLAYAFRGKISNNSITKIVMKLFIEQKLKVLLIGRKHLVNILGSEFNYIRKNSHLFFTNDLSKDDPFVLYAAMYSGLGTKILTRDLMRGHKFLLKDSELKNIFQKWLQKHRLILKTHIGNKVVIKEPLAHLQTTQESVKGIWHLPYQEFKEPGSWSKPSSSPDKWMCIKL